MVNREWLQQAIEGYNTSYAEEEMYKSRFLNLLFFDNCFERSLLTGHITASAWVLTDDLKNVALLHHKKLERWLQPGGHADGDENVKRVAIKELEEETGITTFESIGDSFFDLDIHNIPEHKGVPAHDHYDVRFAFIAKNPEQLRKNSESNEVAWIPLNRLEEYTGSEVSIIRMKEKSLQF